ncbi:MAG TPA: hypothetical protein VHZ73_06990 [Vicinamibacterales bacterium]|jgi:hypothetical protein|nr:hypothetical protein [Vicinamibacterales bacterium]
MRPFLLSACLFALAAAPIAAQTDPVARARALYNQRQFDAAIAAAGEARLVSARADSADLIAARSYLEKFRESADTADLESARERLRGITAGHLSAGERSELVVGLGEDLYLDDASGAAAEMFDSLLGAPLNAPNALGLDARDRVLDWWASALDHEARPRPSAEQQMIYRRIRERMRIELGVTPSSASASYWMAASTLALGDPQAAWDAALAGWLRAPLSAPDQGAALRGDLDRLVQRAIIPERSKLTAQTADACKAEWEAFKDKWAR